MILDSSYEAKIGIVMKNNQNQVADTDLVHNLIEETIAGSLTSVMQMVLNP